MDVDLSETTVNGLAKFRQKPELLIIPLLSFWLIVNVPNWPMFNGSIIVLLANWGTIGAISGSTNSIFPLTYSLAVFSFIFFLLRFRKNLNLGWKRSILLSATIPFGFAAFFETVYQEVFAVVRPKDFHIPLSGQLLLASWIILGLSTLQYWRITRKFYAVITVDVVLFLIWMGIGYPQIYETGPNTVYALILNILTKFTFALTFAVLIYEGTKRKNWEPLRAGAPTKIDL
jgi:hypothetical protein